MSKLHMKKIISCVLFLFLFAFVGSCGPESATTEDASSDMTVNIEAGAVDVDVGQAFTVTFASSVKAFTVNGGTFFVARRGSSSASVSSSPLSKVSRISTAVCNPGNAVQATITNSSTGVCGTTFTLSPDAALEQGTNYAICATPGIMLCSPDASGFFAGAMQEFTTASPEEECVVTDSCSGECGGTGYSNDGGTTCYSDAACSTECPGDTTRPTVEITSAESTLTAQNPFSITITFSEDVTGFALSDMTVTNAAASDLTETTANRVYTASITPTGDPVNITILISEGVVADANGNENEASNEFAIRYDSSILTVAITSGVSDPTNESPFEVTVTFSEEVSGFALGDIAVTNGTAGNFDATGNPVFTSDITPTSDGEVAVEVGAGVATDALTGVKSNTAAAPFSVTYDGTAPTVSSTNPADEDTDVVVSTTVAVTFDKAMDTTTLTTNTANTTCSGSFQVSDDSFTTCVRMAAAPVASNGDKTFTITPLSDLDASTTYQIRITTGATDTVGNPLDSAYTTATGFTTAAPGSMLFVTASGYNGDLGGLAGADAKCMSDTNYPGSGTYKAVVFTLARVPCTSSFCTTGGASENVNWIMAPNTTYTRTDGITVVGTTNDGGVFDTNLTNAFTDSAVYIFTGLSFNWTNGSNYHCDQWTSTTYPSGGIIGDADSTNIEANTGDNAISATTTVCTYSGKLLCVEQ